MKPISLFALLLAAASTVSVFGSPAKFGLRNDFGVLNSSLQENFATVTGGVAVTSTFSDEGYDEASLGVSFAKLSTGLLWFPGPVTQNSFEGHETLLLAGYRHYFQPQSATVRFFCGMDAGVARYSGSAKSMRRLTDGSVLQSERNYTRWKPAAGGSVGCEYNFARNFSLQATYRYTIASELGDFTAGGSFESFHLGQDRSHALLLTLAVKF